MIRFHIPVFILLYLNLPAPSQQVDVSFLKIEVPEKTFIAIIGNENYQSYRDDYTENALHAIMDAERFMNYLVKVRNVPERNISFYPDALTAHIKLYLSKLNHLAENACGEAELIFYYSGKCIIDRDHFEDTYLIPVDISENDLSFAVRVQEIIQKLNSSPVRKITVIIDALDYNLTRSYSLLDTGIEKVILDEKYDKITAFIPKDLELLDSKDNLQNININEFKFSNENIAKTSEQNPPIMVITDPSEEELNKPVIEKDIVFKGYAKDESGIYKVAINGEEAHMEADGSFMAKLILAMGKNEIVVTAIDHFKNIRSEKIIIERIPGSDNSQEYVTRDIDVETSLAAYGDIKYYALIVGVESYENPVFNDLENPVKDARMLYETLMERYSFEQENIILLTNPDYEEMISAFDRFEWELTENDNLLIFYAGHGYWDKRTQQGYWLPADAAYENTARWLRNSTISGYVSGIRAKHILLIADACFSGGIFLTRAALSNASESVNRLYELPSRKAMTSGALEEVPDKSIFFYYLISYLQGNKEKFISAEKLFSSFKPAVLNNSDYIPQFGVIKNAGDEGGDFIFIKK